MNRKQIERAVSLFSQIEKLKEKIKQTETEQERIRIQGARSAELSWYNGDLGSAGSVVVPGTLAQPLFEGVISLLRQEIENSYTELKEMGVEGD
jgi:hypothetical protein